MHQFVYAAVFYKDDNEYTVVFPDLDIFTSGSSLEEAFLLAKDYLRVYCTYSLKYDIEIPEATKIDKVIEDNKKDNTVVMYIDCMIGPKDLK